MTGQIRALNAWTWLLPLGDELTEPSDDTASEWLIRDLIPRGVAWMLAGKWKGGKSWTGLLLALAIALGDSWLAFENCLGRAGRVLLVSLEDDRKQMSRRLWQACRGLGITPNDSRIRENLRIVYKCPRFPLKGELLAELKEWAPDLIVFDSLSRVMTGNQNSIEDAAQFTEQWGALIEETGASVGLLHHTNKGWQGNSVPSLDEVRGSGDLVAYPRHVILMKRTAGHQSVMATVGNLDIRREPWVLEYARETRDDGRVAVTLHDRGDYASERNAHQEAKRARDESRKQSDAKLEAAAIRIARTESVCSAERLRREFQNGPTSPSPSKCDRVLRDLKRRGVMESAPGNKGSRLTAKGLAA